MQLAASSYTDYHTRVKCSTCSPIDIDKLKQCLSLSISIGEQVEHFHACIMIMYNSRRLHRCDLISYSLSNSRRKRDHCH